MDKSDQGRIYKGETNERGKYWKRKKILIGYLIKHDYDTYLMNLRFEKKMSWRIMMKKEIEEISWKRR